MKSSTPLKISIEGNELVIRIGIDTLASAFERSEINNPHNDATDEWEQSFTVTDPRELAKDIIYIIKEPIAGDFGSVSTSLELFLDEACQEAIERGCIGVIETNKIPKD